MRYPANEKLEIIRIVEQSHLPVKRTLAKIGVSRPTFYRWYDLYQRFGEAGLEDRRSGPSRSWNRIPDTMREQILDMALDRPELSPRELAVTFTDERPNSFWEDLQSSEYGFWANVNPDVPHPRWSQAEEKVLGTNDKIPTLLYNGYGEYVAELYKDIDPQQEALFM